MLTLAFSSCVYIKYCKKLIYRGKIADVLEACSQKPWCGLYAHTNTVPPRVTEGFSKSCTSDLRQGLPQFCFSWTNTTDKSDTVVSTVVHTVPQCTPALNSLASSPPVYVGGPFWVRLPAQKLELKGSPYHFFSPPLRSVSVCCEE